MHALVTGGGGFLGRYIVEMLLARGDQVRVFARGDYPELQQSGAEVVRGDITDANSVVRACESVDCAFHTAAMAGISVWRKPFFEVNYRGTQNVLRGCQKHEVPALVYTSSPSVAFAGADQRGVDESAEIDLNWLRKNRAYYSETKAIAELDVLAANGSPGITSCALRPHLIWGPRDAHLIPRLIQRAQAGKLRRVGDGTNLVDTIYVENAAEAHLQAADGLLAGKSPIAGKAYFLSQGAPVNCWSWINDILALANLPPVAKTISLPTAERIGWAFESIYRVCGRIGEPRMTRFLARQLAMSHWFNIEAAVRDFGYQPRISTDEGMRKLGKWLRSPKTGI